MTLPSHICLILIAGRQNEPLVATWGPYCSSEASISQHQNSIPLTAFNLAGVNRMIWG